MKINWKVRFQNKVWLGSFFSLIVGFVYSLLALFDVFPAVTQSLVVQLLNQVLTFLGLPRPPGSGTVNGQWATKRRTGMRSEPGEFPRPFFVCKISGSLTFFPSRASIICHD